MSSASTSKLIRDTQRPISGRRPGSLIGTAALGRDPGEPGVRPTLSCSADDPAIRLAYLDFTYPEIAANLALDEALLIAAEERGGPPLLRIWEPDSLAVVMGASGRIAEDVDVALCRAEGIAIARRSSGGGTVVVGPGTLNVTIILPADAAPGLAAVDTAQCYVLGRLARAIRSRGPAVDVQGLGDLTIGDRKFAGSAQRRLRRHFLVHASLLYSFPIDPINRYTRTPRRQPAYRADRSHQAFLTNIDLPRPALVDAIRSAWPVDDTPVSVPHDLVDRLLQEKYADSAWVERF